MQVNADAGQAKGEALTDAEQWEAYASAIESQLKDGESANRWSAKQSKDGNGPCADSFHALKCRQGAL